MLGPGANIYRTPLNGRNFEFFGEDPFLAGQIAAGYVRGMQGRGVSAVLKHFVTSSSEFDRHHADDVIDERALREIYLRPFEIAVREANPGAVMDAYGITNGVHMTENATLNSSVLKQEWGFQGFVMSDWRATYDGAAAANGGLDLEMPSGSFMNRRALLPALQKNLVSMQTIDEKVRRILRVAVRFGWLDGSASDDSIPLYDQVSNEVALQSARESMVLLKNERAILPLNKDAIKSVLIVGPNAYPAVPVGGGSAALHPFAATSDLEGLSNSLATKAKVYYSRGLPTLSEFANATNFDIDEGGDASGLRVETYSNDQLSGPRLETHIDQHVNYDGALPEDVVNVDFARALAPQPLGTRWTGYYVPKESGAYEIFVQGGGFESKYRLYIDGKLVIDCWRGVKSVLSMSTLSLAASPHKIVLESYRPVPFGGLRLRLGIARQGSLVDPEAEVMAKKADAVVVTVGFNREIERETGDRTFSLPFGQDELIQRMVDKNPKTIVVLQSGGSVDMRAWLQRVPALIENWYPGQAGGRY
jgi:beta-glucosidase